MDESNEVYEWVRDNLFGDRIVDGIVIPLSVTQEAIAKICCEAIVQWENRDQTVPRNPSK